MSEENQVKESVLSVCSEIRDRLDEAASFINEFLDEMPLQKEAHNWLIRNGYKDTSYQGDFWGPEVVP